MDFDMASNFSYLNHFCSEFCANLWHRHRLIPTLWSSSAISVQNSRGAGQKGYGRGARNFSLTHVWPQRISGRIREQNLSLTQNPGATVRLRLRARFLNFSNIMDKTHVGWISPPSHDAWSRSHKEFFIKTSAISKASNWAPLPTEYAWNKWLLSTERFTVC